MKLVAISCVRDELDIVEPFVRHTLAHVDRLVILDNGSTDGTRQLLQQLVDEGLPLEVVDDPTPGNYQWRRMTHLMHDYAIQKYDADWIVPLDADEFLAVDDLVEVLRQESEGNSPIAIRWQTYVPDATDNPGEPNPVLRIQHRLRVEGQPCIKVMIPSQLARRPGTTILQGNHGLAENGCLIESQVTQDAFLSHFPGRSPEQYGRKIAIKHLQYLAMSDRHPDWGCHYRESTALLRSDSSLLNAAFQQSILFYNAPKELQFQPELIVAPAAYRGGPLRYTPDQPIKPLFQSLLECAEMIASSHGAVANERNKLQSNLSELDLKVRRQEVDLTRLNVELQRNEADMSRLHLELQQNAANLWAMHQSWSWRIGRTMTSPVRWLRQRLRQIQEETSVGDNSLPSQGSKAA